MFLKFFYFMMCVLCFIVIGLIGSQFFKQGQGEALVTVTDVMIAGAYIESCEIEGQYGENSSKIEAFSSLDHGFCGEMKYLIGKKVKIKYKTFGMCFKTYSCDIIDSYEVMKK